VRTLVYILGIVTVAGGCGYDNLPNDNKHLQGVWTIEQVYSNDYWGGPLSWRNINGDKQIEFTSDNKFYQREASEFELIGTYKVLSEKNLEITWDKPLNPQFPGYQLNYEFDSEGYLIISTGTFEGVVSEKYKFTRKL
jgi:hypothetical protein